MPESLQNNDQIIHIKLENPLFETEWLDKHWCHCQGIKDHLALRSVPSFSPFVIRLWKSQRPYTRREVDVRGQKKRTRVGWSLFPSLFRQPLLPASTSLPSSRSLWWETLIGNGNWTFSNPLAFRGWPWLAQFLRPMNSTPSCSQPGCPFSFRSLSLFFFFFFSPRSELQQLGG